MLDKRIPPLWENRAQDFHLAGEVLGLATGLIVHSHFVHDGSTGRVVDPDAAAVGSAAVWLRDHPDEAVAFGQAGKAIALGVTWDTSIGRLLS